MAVHEQLPSNLRDEFHELFDKHLRGMPNALMIAHADHALGCVGDLYFSLLNSFYDKDYPELISLHEQTKPTRLGCGVQ